MPVYFLNTAKLGPVNTRLSHAGVPSVGGSPLMTIILAAIVAAVVIGGLVLLSRSQQDG